MQQTADLGDAPGDVTWMSYAELGRSRGISTASAKRLSNRRRWRKQAGNDGTTRVAVPVDEAVPRETASGDDPGDVSFNARALGILESALTEANKRAEAALALADRADARADRAEARAEAAEHAAKQAQGEALATAQAAEAVRRADAARKARGLLARLRAAVRGE